MSAVASNTGKEAFTYWVKTVLPNVYDERLDFEEQLARVNSYMDGLYSVLHEAVFNITRMGTTFETLRYYLSAFANTPVEGEEQEDFDPQTLEGFREEFIQYNVDTTTKLNDMFFGLIN